MNTSDDDDTPGAGDARPADRPTDRTASPWTMEHERLIAGASWALAARDAAIEDCDALAAGQLDGLVLTAIREAGAVGIEPDRLAAELDYPGGADAMVNPSELDDPDFHPRLDLEFDPTLAATTPEEAVQWLTARLGDRSKAEQTVAQYQDAVLADDPFSDGWVGSLSPHEMEFLAQGGARPGESFEQALSRIEQTDPEDLIPVDLDTPVPYELTDPGRTSAAGEPGPAFQTADVYTDADLAAIAEATARGDEQAADRLRARPSRDPVLLSMPSGNADAAAVVGLECPECGEDAVEQTPDTLVPYSSGGPPTYGIRRARTRSPERTVVVLD
jgi:hypothetical protein